MKFQLVEEVNIKNIFPASKFRFKVYNGSSTKYDKLDFSKVNSYDDGYLGKGMYVTEDKEYARSYGTYIHSFFVNTRNPFNFSDMPARMKKEMCRGISANYLDKVSNGECPNFEYFVNTLSSKYLTEDEVNMLKYSLTMAKKGKLSHGDFYYSLLTIFNNPYCIFQGALMDFSNFLTPFLQRHGYDCAYIATNDCPHKEILVFDIDQLYMIKE